jgi:Laminin G domain.
MKKLFIFLFLLPFFFFPLLTHADLTTELRGYYSLNGNSTDDTGINNGTDTAITYSNGNGIIPQGAGFNGTTSKIMLPANGFSNAQMASGSIELWFKTSSIPSVEDDLLSIEGWISIQIDVTTGKLIVQSDGTPTFASSAGSVCDGNWHQCILTWDATHTNLYLDNGSPITVTPTGSPTPDSTSRTNAIGAQWSGTLGFFTGDIDEVGIWSRALTSTEVGQLYNSGAGLAYPFTVTPIAWSGSEGGICAEGEVCYYDWLIPVGIIIFFLSLIVCGPIIKSLFPRKWKS